jgi:hypothetical protein
LDVTEDLGNQRRILDAGNDSEVPAAIRAGLDIEPMAMR